jgi:hypothetical protein
MRPRWRPPAVLIAVLTLGAIAPASSAVAAPASWQWAPAGPPPAPPGTPTTAFPVPLGGVGQISFWAPNRGLLIEEGSPGTKKCTTTSATALVACGLYAYNGESWHLLSTVCGAQNGRIAWAGPEEFWTISDQRPGQFTGQKSLTTHDVSLCHFLNGQVVGSYATPLGLPNSYKQMNAAACLSANNCWFGGALGEPPTKGAFHLHWDGQNVTTVYSPEAHAIGSMALAGPSTLFETVELNPGSVGDEYGLEDPKHPYVLHQIDPPGSSIDFHDVFLADGACKSETCPPLPSYESAPELLSGFKLGSDYTASNAAPQLWAVAAPRREQGQTALPIVLRYTRASPGLGEWTQFGELGGLLAKQERNVQGVLNAVAAEPGEASQPGAAAWVTIGSADEEAHVDRLEVQGEGKGREGKARITNQETLGEKLGEKQGPGKLGSAGPIACPASNDCWMATNQGWLFHLTEDPAHPERTPGYPVDMDPNFAGVIGFRPPDEGVPQLPSIEPPPDVSLANQEALAPLKKTNAPAPTRRTSRPLVTDVSSHVIHRYTLALSFKLTVKARVQLLASRQRRRVAQTAAKILKAGKHTLMLRLDPRRWPNKLDMKASPLEALPTVESGGVSGQTVAPPIGANSVGT